MVISSIHFFFVLRAKKRLGLEVGLAGCINSFAAGSTVSPDEYSLAYSPQNMDLVGGLDIWECGTNPCSSIPCQNGGDCFMSDREVYHCVCEDGFTGKCWHCIIHLSLVIHCDLVLFVLDNKSILVYGMSTETLLKEVNNLGNNESGILKSTRNASWDYCRMIIPQVLIMKILQHYF